MGLCPEHPEQCHLGIPQKPSHGRRRGKAKRGAQRHPQGIHLRMESHQGEGRGGAEEAEGEAGQEEGDQGRAGEEAQSAEEGRGRRGGGGGGVNWPPTWRNNWQPPLPKTFLTGFCCKRFLEYFAVLKTKWLCISILKLYWIILSLL